MHHKQTGELQSAIFQISDFFFFVEGGILCGEYIQGVQFFSQAKPVTWALLSSEKSAKEKKKHFIKFRGNKRVLSVPH